MEFTRRYAVVAGLAVALSATAVVVERPFPLLGAVGLGAWLLAHQFHFVRRAGKAVEDVVVDLEIAETQVTTDRDVEVDVVVTTDAPAPVEVTIDPPIPTAGRVSTPVEPARLAVGETVTELAYSIRFPVAGTYWFDRVTLGLEDGAGFFGETVEAGERTSVDVEPSAIRNLHIGRAGERAASVFGEDPGPRAMRGLEPATVRPYQEGDQAAHIDWWATARLNELHVREFSFDVSGRDAGLIVDRRPRLAVGPPGETMLDYARAVGIAYLVGAVRSTTEFSLYLVDQEAVREVGSLGDDAGGYYWLRRSLEAISADRADGRPTRLSPDRSGPRAVVGRRLSSGETSFDRGLRPYFDADTARTRRSGPAPLTSAVRTWLSASSPPRETVLITDDSERASLVEAIGEATGDGGQVTVLLLPRVLFEVEGVVTLEDAYDRYRSFERFRRGLDRRPDVTALEVGPGDRIDEILSAGR